MLSEDRMRRKLRGDLSTWVDREEKVGEDGRAGGLSCFRSKGSEVFQEEEVIDNNNCSKQSQ